VAGDYRLQNHRKENDLENMRRHSELVYLVHLFQLMSFCPSFIRNICHWWFIYPRYIKHQYYTLPFMLMIGGENVDFGMF
jgi:hypothetical protein